jgi:Zn-dependent protease
VAKACILLPDEPRMLRGDGVVWQGWFPLGASRRIELSLHLFGVLTLVAVTWLLAIAFLPHTFPGWRPSSYWMVASAVAVTDGLAGLVHELGHAIIAVSRGRRVYRITLYGLAAKVRRSAGPLHPRDQFAIALAGPVSHLAVACVLLCTWHLLPIDNEPLRVAAGFPAVSNFAAGLLNLLPISPLDGARVARAVIASVFRI